MELTNKEILDTADGLAQLENLHITDPKTSWKIARSSASLQKEAKIIRKLLTSKLAEKTEKDEKGNIKSDGRNFVFTNKASEEEYTATEDAILSQKTDVNSILPLKEEDLNQLDITPKLKRMILPIIS